MSTITYQQVFKVSNIGDELQEGQQVNYTPCPAANSLRQLLMAYAFFSGGKVQGTGPLYRPWSGNTHEFNRHHAGLAVDIMLNQQNDAEVALGQQLVMLFCTYVSVMNWRDIIYQRVGISPRGTRRRESEHMDHIHIDWHDNKNVQWHTGINSIPLRMRDSTILHLPLVQGNRIASSITWTSEALTDFNEDTNLASEISSLLEKYTNGELTKIPWSVD